MIDDRRHSVTKESAPTAADRARYHEDLAVFRRRKRLALAVGVVSTVLAILLIAFGVALALGAQNTISGKFLVQQHVPGPDGSISLPENGTYAIHSAERDLPECTVTDLDGARLTTTRSTAPEAPDVPLAMFEAAKGGYTVHCEGGNDGVSVYSTDNLDTVFNGWRSLLLQAVPFVVAGLALLAVARFVPARIAPERLRPVIPD